MFSWSMPQGSAGGGTPVNTFGANASGMGTPVNTMFGTNPNAGGNTGIVPPLTGIYAAGSMGDPTASAASNQINALQQRILTQNGQGGMGQPGFSMPSGPYGSPTWSPGMSAPGGGFGAALSSSAGQVSPYLRQQLGALQQQGTQNLLQNIMPGIRSGAQAVGGIGGAREGIAEGVAAGNAQAGIAAAQANAINDAYNQAQNRALQGYGMDQNSALGFLNSDRNYSTALGGLGNQAFSNQTTRDLGFGNLGLGYAQNQTSRDLGFGNLGLGYTNAGNNLALGMGGLANQAQANANNYALGQANVGLGYYNGANSYDLGLRNNDLGYFNGQNSFTLGQQQNQNQANQIANNFTLGQGQLGLQGQGQMLDFFNTQGQQDISRYLAGLQGFQVGSNSPWGPLSQYGNLLSPYTGNGTTTQTSSQGGGAMGAFGGALGAMQLANLFGRQP